MPDRLHTLLRRQLKRCFGDVDRVPPECRPLIDIIDEAYRQADVDRTMLERSLELSSEELGDANGQLRQAITDLQAAHRDMEARVVDRTRALEAANDRLRQSQKMEAIGQLAGGIAHDFNNLLTVINGCAELLVMSNPSELHRVEVDEIRKAAQRASALTHQLLAFSRKQMLEPKTVDLNRIVLGLQTMLIRLIREDITLLVEPSLAEAWVRVDPNQIEQVLINLVVNARDALPNGGQIRLDVSPAVGADGRATVQLRVSDNGVGMTPEVSARVFEPFFTTKDTGRGTGLGLASVHGIVHQSNGSISVESAPEGGTTFTLVFPEAAPIGAGVAPAERHPDDAGRETILLVEDEAPVRRVIGRMLEQCGYTVIEAGSAGAACAEFDERSKDIDLLITDVVMPGMRGPALAERLVAIRPELRVLFISGHADLEPSAPGLHSRGMSFLRKPIEVSRLATKVRELLASP